MAMHIRETRRRESMIPSWHAWAVAALWIVLSAASLCAFADEPAGDPRAAAPSPPAPVDSQDELSPEAHEIVARLRSSLPEVSEARQMLDAILAGSQLGPGEGWFRTAVAQTRFTWETVRQQYDASADGRIAADEFPGSNEDFFRIDRNRDEALTEADFQWQETGIPRDAGAMLFYQADADGNGQVTRNEFAQLFDRWDSGGAGYLSLDEVRERLAPPAPARGQTNAGPGREVLLRGLARQEIGSLQPGPALDEPAPDFTLPTVDGKETITLSQKIGEKPVVLIFGNFTCGPFRSQAGNLETLYRRYRDRAEFVLVYVREAHPRDGWKMESNERRGVDLLQPATYDERAAVAAVCRRRLALGVPFLVDTIDDAVGARYSGMPSRLYLIDGEGRIAFKSGRGPFGFRPAELEQNLLLLIAESRPASLP
jgi:hypothetical protein